MLEHRPRVRIAAAAGGAFMFVFAAAMAGSAFMISGGLDLNGMEASPVRPVADASAYEPSAEWRRTNYDPYAPQPTDGGAPYDAALPAPPPEPSLTAEHAMDEPLYEDGAAYDAQADLDELAQGVDEPSQDSEDVMGIDETTFETEAAPAPAEEAEPESTVENGLTVEETYPHAL